MPAAQHDQGEPRRSIAASVIALSAGRGVANASLRWIPLFLPTIARSLDTSLGRCAALLGVGELLGVTGLFTGAWVQRLGPRLGLLVGLVVVAGANALAWASGTLLGFAVGYGLNVFGQSLCFIGGQSWIGNEVPRDLRGRYLGFYESSWALALLLGAPLAALVIGWSWRAPYGLWATLTLVMAIAVPRRLGRGRPGERPAGERQGRRGLGRAGWGAVGITFLLMFASLSVVIVSGAWVEDRFGFGPRGLALIAFLLGGAELAASITAARVGDRWGSSRSTRRGMAMLIVAAAAMALAGPHALLGVSALCLFVGSFEFSFVSTLGLAVRQDPAVVARLVGTIGASGTIARALAAAVAGWMYEVGGIAAVALTTIGFAVAVLFALLVVGPGGAPGRPQPASG